MGKSIGIDLGTTYSVIGFKDTSVRIVRNNNNEELTRSFVAQNAKKDFLVGNKAYGQMPRYIPNAVISVKRLMGMSIKDEAVEKMKADKEYYPYAITKLSAGTDNAVAVVLQGVEYTPEQISAEILRQLKNDASEKEGEVTHAVITVPAYFTEKQKTATRVAANLAGLKVKRLLAEPTAAAISYGMNMKEGEGKVVLVYDFGGGTFDLSILIISDNHFIEAATGGDRWLGGDNIDKVIKEYIDDEFYKMKGCSIAELLRGMPPSKQGTFIASLRKEIEDAKILLSAAPSADILLSSMLENKEGDPVDVEISLTRDKFESLIRPLISQTVQLTDDFLEKNGYPIDTIDHILLVGGSSCIPLVKKMLTDKYGNGKVLSSEKPMLAVAEGAAILAHDLPDDFECPVCGAELVADQTVCPQCNANVSAIVLGIERPSGNTVQVQHTTSHNYFINLSRNGIDFKDKFIDNAEVLPLTKPEVFRTLMENQKIVKIEIFADVENGTFERQGLGFFTIQENLPVNSELVFDFYLDLDQTFSLHVYPKGKKDQRVKVNLTRGNKDEKSLDAIATIIDKVYASNISDAKKTKFINDVQKQIERINKDLQNAASDAMAWDDIERIIKQSEQEAFTEESNVQLYYIFGRIISDYFSNYIDRTDLTTLRNMMSHFERSQNDWEKAEILEKLESFIIEGHFLIFINIFSFKLYADGSNDPADANRLTAAYNDAMAALQAGNYDRVVFILNNTVIPDNGSVFGSLTTGIGKKG